MLSTSSSEQFNSPLENFHSFTPREARFNSFSSARPRKLKNFEVAECPPPIAQRPRTEARFISNALLFSEELKTEFVLCDGQLSFSHWILQVEPSPCLVATFSMTWTLPWQRLVQFLKQLFAQYDSTTAYCFPRSISRWGR